MHDAGRCRICGAPLPALAGRGRPRVICPARRCRNVYSTRMRLAARLERWAARIDDPDRQQQIRARADRLRRSAHVDTGTDRRIMQDGAGPSCELETDA